MRLIIALLVLAIALVVAVTPAAADNPPGTGQPSQSCEEQPSGPPGFDTAGFAHAQTVYANVDGTPRVSQYDVACFQISQH